ncbi:MAG TPA: hypothetical protein VMW38_24040 [Terriglobia bacterium]|nr:hypothetical protein [Terriglobia bacterium]
MSKIHAASQLAATKAGASSRTQNQPGLFGPANHAHAATAQLSDDSVMGNCFADHGSYQQSGVSFPPLARTSQVTIVGWDQASFAVRRLPSVPHGASQSRA